MQIITQHRTGGTEVLELVQHADPRPHDGEILVRNRAAGVNPVDTAVREGWYPLLGEPPFTLGWDVAGEVLAIGGDVTGFAVGDRVFGMPHFPAQAAAYATHVVAPAAQMAILPETLTFSEGGALPLAGLTAWQAMVTHGGIEAGQKVLIHGGAGGVGHLAVQIASALGADVSATASAAKLATLRRLGARTAIDYKTSPIGEAYDLILDPQSGEQAEASVSAAKSGGRVITLLPPSDAAVAMAEKKGVNLLSMTVAPDAEGLRALADLAERGKLRPIIAGTWPLTEAGAAMDALQNMPEGKIVILP